MTERESSLYGLPVYRLTTTQTKAWRHNDDFRGKCAKWLGSKFTRGVILCRDTMRVIAFVSPAGNVSPAKPPYRRLPIDLIANAPEAENCQCQAWVHPESEIWAKNAASKDEHHPYCQFHQQSIPNWIRDLGDFHGAKEALTLDGRKVDRV